MSSFTTWTKRVVDRFGGSEFCIAAFFFLAGIEFYRKPPEWQPTVLTAVFRAGPLLFLGLLFIGHRLQRGKRRSTGLANHS